MACSTDLAVLQTSGRVCRAVGAVLPAMRCDRQSNAACGPAPSRRSVAHNKDAPLQPTLSLPAVRRCGDLVRRPPPGRPRTFSRVRVLLRSTHKVPWCQPGGAPRGQRHVASHACRQYLKTGTAFDRAHPAAATLQLDENHDGAAAAAALSDNRLRPPRGPCAVSLAFFCSRCYYSNEHSQQGATRYIAGLPNDGE